MPCEPGRAHQSRRELEEVREDPTHERSERSSKCFFESHQAISQGGQTRLPEQINGFVRPNCRPPMKARGEKRAKDACILRQPRPGIWAGSFIVTESSTVKNMDGMCSLKG